jgi:FkbM family methyltransferase
MRRKPDIIKNNGILIRLADEIHPHIKSRIYENKYERREMLLLKKTLKSEDIVLDIGSGIGQTAILCAKITKKKVFAIEANPDLIPLISENAALNNVSIEIIHGAISTNQGVADFYLQDKFYASSLTPCENARKVSVPLIPIDIFLKEAKPTYISMDAEGAEYDVLPHVTKSQVRAISVETHDNGDAISLIGKMKDNGFTLSYNRKKILHFC